MHLATGTQHLRSQRSVMERDAMREYFLFLWKILDDWAVAGDMVLCWQVEAWPVVPRWDSQGFSHRTNHIIMFGQHSVHLSSKNYSVWWLVQDKYSCGVFKLLLYCHVVPTIPQNGPPTRNELLPAHYCVELLLLQSSVLYNGRLLMWPPCLQVWVWRIDMEQIC